ncbi:hypothetical protein FJY84_03790 [Candidatus Bathyarchaeota archaeon]|nr:hypothetical protein [Candidatus Bathyarchaeota archaeon]
MKVKIILLDTSAFINGYNFYQKEPIYTVPNVKREIRNEITLIKYESAVRSGNLIEKIPTQENIDQIEKITESLGESHVLSVTDKQILALSLMLKSQNNDLEIITDDYSVQNIASKIDLKYKSTTTKGITKRLNWVIYCPGCKKKYEKMPGDVTCIICGTKLKRKPNKNG